MAGILLNRSRQAPAEETPAFGGIAERFRRAGDLDRAIALCRDGLKRFPDQLSARVTLGWALLDKGQYEEARAELERVLRKAPDNLAAIRGLAELHDRSEGAMPAEESWQHDESAATTTFAQAPAPQVNQASQSAAAAHAPASVAATPAPIVSKSPQAEVDPFAPIAVSLPSAGLSSAPELLQTAEQAGLAAEEAAAEFSLLGQSVDEGKVEIEDPAAASMAAAGAAFEPPVVLPIEKQNAEAVAFDAIEEDVEAEIAKLGQAEVAMFDAGDTSAFSALEEVTGPAPAIELGEGLSVDAAAEADNAADLDAVIRALESDRGPEIDFGSATDVALVEEADPEVAEAARALEAISFETSEEPAAEYTLSLDAGVEPAAGVVPAPQPSRVDDVPVIDFGVAELDVERPDTAAAQKNKKSKKAKVQAKPKPIEIAPVVAETPAREAAPVIAETPVVEAVAVAPPRPVAEASPVVDVADVETPVAESPTFEAAAFDGLLSLQAPDQIYADVVIASVASEEGFGKAAGSLALPEATPEPEPTLEVVEAAVEPAVEPEPTGPVFELVAPEPIDPVEILAEAEESDVDLGGVADRLTADLFAAMEAEPELELELESASTLEPALESALEPAVESELRPALESEFESELESELDEPVDVTGDVEHFVDVADSGPLWVPNPSDIRPVVEHATAGLVADLMAGARNAPLEMGVVGLDAVSSRRSRSQASVVALERLLKKVEARRLQLQSESVA